MEKKEAKFQIGDHVFVMHSINHLHHGIVDGEDTIVHFTSHVDGNTDSNGLVQRITIVDFIKDYPFGVCQYGTSQGEDTGINLLWPGTYSHRACDSVGEVLGRVERCLKNGFGEYQILGNNCEDFASYCKTGEKLPSTAQLQATMTRVAATRSALEAGHKNPVVLAGCLFGWFNESDFEHRKVQASTTENNQDKINEK